MMTPEEIRTLREREGWDCAGCDKRQKWGARCFTLYDGADRKHICFDCWRAAFPNER